MKTMKILSYGAVISFFALLASCGNSVTTEQAHGEEEEHHEEGGTSVELTKQQYESIKIELGGIEQKNLSEVLKTTGFLKVPPQNKASISSTMGGIVQSILMLEGDYVKKGQTVATLVNPEFVSMQEEYLNTQSQLTFAEAEYNRQKELSEKNVSSQKTFQQASAAYSSLKAKLSSLRQQLSLLNLDPSTLTQDNMASVISVKSPINGNISHIDINIGTRIEGSNPLMDVVDNTQLHLDLFVFEQDLQKVKEGQMVDFILTNLTGKNFTAKIFAVGNAFENETKTISVHAVITGDKTGLIEGMNVTALINMGENLVPAVPSTALTSFAGTDFIFFQSQGHEHAEQGHNEKESHQEKEELGDIFTFQKVQVKKGVTNGNYTEITLLEEVPENAKVVVNGAFYLMAMLTNEGEHEH